MECVLCQSEYSMPFLFFSCFLMKKQKDGLCPSCQLYFTKMTSPACLSCQKPGSQEMCDDCLEWKVKGHIIQHQALFQYDDRMSAFFYQYKQNGDYQIRFAFAKEIQEALKKYKDYTIVPIPVSKERYQERGFNQVEGLLDAAGIPYLSLLKKQDVQHQIGKNRIERLRLDQVFSLREKNSLPKKILLVDDVYTTGATLETAKRVFLENNVKVIKTFSLAR